MKRFFQLMIVAIVVLTACCACSKVNDIDKRLGVLENIVSDLKAQISAGAVITSVDKTSDGCTFTLSNGQTYTVTNGKDGADGTDGEAIIADVKIEEDFVVLTLKNGETLRISYQNPLSMVTLNIVPDYDDGTVRKPNTTEFNGEKSTIFYLDVAVTPAKYAEILSDTERFIHKAVFSPVLTKSGFGNAFTVSPKSVIYAEGAPIPFLEASFELDEETATLLLNKNTPYTVSYSIEDADGAHGASTPFVSVAWYTRDGSGGDVVDFNGHKAVKLAGSYWATENVEDEGICTALNGVYDARYGCYFNQCRGNTGEYDANNNNALNVIMFWGDNWTLPDKEQWQDLLDYCKWTYTRIDGKNGYLVEGKSQYGEEGNSIFLPCNGYYSNESKPHEQNYGGYYWASNEGTCLEMIDLWAKVSTTRSTKYMSVRPVYGQAQVVF